MAMLVLAMQFLGVTMVASLADYGTLVAIHRPFGIAILILVLVRLANRSPTRAPSLPPTVPPPERVVALASEALMYALLVALPLVVWGMLSAGRYPIVLWSPVHLPASPMLDTSRRRAQTLLAYLLFFTVLAHIGAILFHTLIVRDGLLGRMTFGRREERVDPQARFELS